MSIPNTSIVYKDGFSKSGHTGNFCDSGFSPHCTKHAYLAWEFRSDPNPHISVVELGGLTPDQVIARLGPPGPFPFSDPRKPNPNDPKFPPWTPDQERERGPLVLEYDDYVLYKNGHNNDWFPPHVGHSYGIVFEDGRVAEDNSRKALDENINIGNSKGTFMFMIDWGEGFDLYDLFRAGKLTTGWFSGGHHQRRRRQFHRQRQPHLQPGRHVLSRKVQKGRESIAMNSCIGG